MCFVDYSTIEIKTTLTTISISHFCCASIALAIFLITERKYNKYESRQTKTTKKHKNEMARQRQYIARTRQTNNCYFFPFAYLF